MHVRVRITLYRYWCWRPQPTYKHSLDKHEPIHQPTEDIQASIKRIFLLAPSLQTSQSLFLKYPSLPVANLKIRTGELVKSVWVCNVFTHHLLSLRMKKSNYTSSIKAPKLKALLYRSELMCGVLTQQHTRHGVSRNHSTPTSACRCQVKTILSISYLITRHFKHMFWVVPGSSHSSFTFLNVPKWIICKMSGMTFGVNYRLD